MKKDRGLRTVLTLGLKLAISANKKLSFQAPHAPLTKSRSQAPSKIPFQKTICNISASVLMTFYMFYISMVEFTFFIT